MRAALLFVLLAAAALALLLAFRQDPARAMAEDAGELLALPVEGSSTTLFERVVRGGAAREGANGEVTLRLYGVRAACRDKPSEDLELHAVARDSLVAALREQAAERGIELQIDGDYFPAKQGALDGASFLVELGAGEQSLEYTHPAGERLRVARPAPSRADWRLLALAGALALSAVLLALSSASSAAAPEGGAGAPS